MTTAHASASAPARPLSAALDKTFKIGMALKCLDGVLEVAGGLLLVFLSPHAIQRIVRTLTVHELSQDPHDFVASHLLHTAGQLTAGATLFGAIYLLSHGVAKVVLVALLLRDKLWAYPWMIVLADLVRVPKQADRATTRTADSTGRLTGRERKPIAVSAPGRSSPRLRSR